MITETTEENLELPLEDEKPKRKPRVAKPRATKVVTQAMRMLEAVNFIMPAQKKTGRIENRFCRIVNDWIVASTDALMIACPIEGMVDCCPNSVMLRASLMDCGDDINVTALSEEAISVMSGDFKAVIPCVREDQIFLFDPDEQVGEAGDSLKASIAAIYGILETNKTAKELYKTLLIQDQTCIAGNGPIVLEAYHGCNLPNDIVISKEAAQAVVKSKLPITGFGFGPKSFTFYFENGAFIRAARSDRDIPNVQGILNPASGESWPVPDNFFKALKSIAPFSQDEFVHFKEGLITSDTEANEASTFNMDTLHTGISINIKNLLKLKDVFDNVVLGKRSVTFRKDSVRGAMSVSITQELEDETK